MNSNNERVRIDARVYDSQSMRRARTIGKVVGYSIVTVLGLGVLTIISAIIAVIVRGLL